MAALAPHEVYTLALWAIPQVMWKYPVPDQTAFARVLVAQAFQESCTNKKAEGYKCFDPDASPKSSSALGVWQTLKGTQRAIEKMMKWPQRPLDDRRIPSYSALLGAAYMGYQYSRYGDWRKALKAYHDGHWSKKKTKGDTYASLVLDKHMRLFDFTAMEQMPGVGVLAVVNRTEFN